MLGIIKKRGKAQEKFFPTRIVAVIPTHNGEDSIALVIKSKALNWTLPQIIEKEGINAFFMFFDAGNVFDKDFLKKALPYIKVYPIIQFRTRNADYTHLGFKNVCDYVCIFPSKFKLPLIILEFLPY